MTCEHCDDGEGHSIYPYYGLAPHVHTRPVGGTKFDPRKDLPENFLPDGDDEGCGTYMYCPQCGPRSKQ